MSPKVFEVMPRTYVETKKVKFLMEKRLKEKDQVKEG